MEKTLKTLYILTLEPIEKRYTKQWYNYFKKGFGEFFKVKYIDGPPVPDKIEKGRFLDINRTNIWKAEQTKQVAQLFADGKIKDDDIFFFADAWHFGITAIKYMAQLQDIKIKMFGYWHAGSYDPADFVAQAGLGKWAGCHEIGWLKTLDGSFVATHFHKKLIVGYFGKDVEANKIHVVGFPMDWDKEIKKEIKKTWGAYEYPREPLVAFPHRVDKEKAPEKFDQLTNKMPQYKWIKTIEVTNTKKEYYEILKRSKVVFSASTQETFGIGTVEAMFIGAIPVVPDSLSYVEMYDPLFKYTNLVTAKQKIKYIMENYGVNNNKGKALEKARLRNVSKIRKQSLESIPKMARVMNYA